MKTIAMADNTAYEILTLRKHLQTKEESLAMLMEENKTLKGLVNEAAKDSQRSLEELKHLQGHLSTLEAHNITLEAHLATIEESRDSSIAKAVLEAKLLESRTLLRHAAQMLAEFNALTSMKLGDGIFLEGASIQVRSLEDFADSIDRLCNNPTLVTP